MTPPRWRSVAAALLLLAATGWAQGTRVEGRALGEDRQPLAAVGVRAVHSGAVTHSDFNGRFALIADENDSLQLTRLGYRTVLVRAGSRDIVMSPVPIALSPLSVTSARRAIQSLDMAGANLVVDSTEIRHSPAPNIAALIEHQSGLQFSSGIPSGQSVMIRGLGDERVLVLVDGDPVQGTSLRSFDLSRQGVSGVDRVEVVKGPMSALYGSDALGGVINIISTHPGRTGKGMTLSTLSGTGGRVDLAANANRTIHSTNAQLDATWRHVGETPGVPSTEGAFSRDGELGFQFGHLFARRIHVEGGAKGSIERQRWISQRDPTRYYAFNDNAGVSSRLSMNAVAGAWSLHSQLSASDFSHTYSLSTLTKPIRGGGDPPQRETTARWSMDADRSFGSHHFGVGTLLDAERLASPGKVEGDRVIEKNAAFYVDDQWTVASFILSGAARRTESGRWGGVWTPQLGAVWHATASAVLRASYGGGFRAPSYKERGYTFVNLAAGYELRGDSALRPEHSTAIGIGGSWIPSSQLGTLRLDVDLYRNDLHRLIDYRQIGTASTGLLIYTPVNVQSARTQGIEVAAIVERGRWLTHLTWALLDARDLTDGVPLSLRARNSGAWLVERSGADATTASLTLSYTGPAEQTGVDPTTGVGSVSGRRAQLTTVDAQLRRRLMRGMELSAGVTNLLDARAEGWSAPLRRAMTVGAMWKI